MKRFLVILLFSIISICTYAQKVRVESFGINTNDLEAKLNPIYDIKAVPGALIRIHGRTEGLQFEGEILLGPVVEEDECLLYMRTGATELTIRWGKRSNITYTFPLALQSTISYDMTITNNLPKPEEQKYLISPVLGYNGGKLSYGVMAATMKRSGVYVKFHSNFRALPKTDYECDSKGIIDQNLTTWYTGNEATQRISFTAGGITRAINHVYLYGGMGYGKRGLAWEMYGDTYALVKGSSFNGPELEAGAIIHVGPVAFSAGLSTISAKWVDATFGLGILF